jgi:hypothetical protein
MIKGFILAVVVASPFAAPTLGFAQNNGPVTRAQVHADLVQLRKAGYDPQTDHVTYPDDMQAAQRRVYGEAGSNASGWKSGQATQK